MVCNLLHTSVMTFTHSVGFCDLDFWSAVMAVRQTVLHYYCWARHRRWPTSLSDIIVKATNPWMLWQLVPTLLKHTLTSHSFTSMLLVTLMRGWMIVSGPYGTLPHSLIIHIIDCHFFRKALQWVPVGSWRCFGWKAKVKGIQRKWHV